MAGWLLSIHLWCEIESEKERERERAYYLGTVQPNVYAKLSAS
jgi:hypothetical protein